MLRLNHLIYLLLLILVLPAARADEGDLLEPDRAFSLQATLGPGDVAHAAWTIADGYYMYRDKISLSTDTPGVRLGEPTLPPGKTKHDENFGDVTIYRHQVTVDVPVIREDPGVTSFKLIAKSRGCADVGVCYPPHTQVVSLSLPPAPAAQTSGGAGGAAGGLAQLQDNLGLGQADDEFLEPDKAFAFSASVGDADTILGHWKIAEGYYLYRDKFKFKLKDAQGAVLGEIALPPGDTKHDPNFGDVQVFHHEVDARIGIKRSTNAALPVTLEATFQGCASAGVCYSPITKDVALTLPAASGAAATATTGTQAPMPGAPMTAAPAAQGGAPLSEQDTIAHRLASGNVWLTVLSFFGFGLLLAFTPCVFPMIPILSSIIVGQGSSLTTRRAFTMSLTYVLAMAVTYTIAGVVAGMVGQNLQAAFQNPWILSAFAAIFVALSLSMFGFYDLQLPSSLQSKLAEISNRQQGGTLIGVGIMGVLSALIVGPCVAAPLAGALIYIGQTGDPWLGGVALFALSLGMGAPLVAIGTSAGKLLPRAGGWMDAVKGVFGVALLGVAIWMLERILPATLTMLLWAVLFIVSASYMGALQPIKEGASGWFRLWKGLGLVLLIIGTLELLGVAAGGSDYMQPLRGVWSGGGGLVSAEHATFKRITSPAQLDQELAAARAQGKPVMLDFYADWCTSCKEYERNTFTDPKVAQALSRFVLLQADVTLDNADSKALLGRYRLFGPPAILFFGPDGQERRNLRLVGYKDPQEFTAHLAQVN